MSEAGQRLINASHEAAKAMERFDALPREFRDLANEYGMTLVERFMRTSTDPSVVKEKLEDHRRQNDPTFAVRRAVGETRKRV